MKIQFKSLAFIGVVLLTSVQAFAQITCSGSGSTPPTPAQIPPASVRIRTFPGNLPVTSIAPNTQYRIDVTQPSGSQNSFWNVPAGEGFGFVQVANGFGNDAGPGQTTGAVITSDALGGVITFNIRGGSGGGVFQTCLSDRTRVVLP